MYTETKKAGSGGPAAATNKKRLLAQPLIHVNENDFYCFAALVEVETLVVTSLEAV